MGCKDLRKYVGAIEAAEQAASSGRKERVSRSATLEERAFLQKRKWVSKAAHTLPRGSLERKVTRTCYSLPLYGCMHNTLKSRLSQFL